MTEIELELVINDYIKTIYNAEYTGYLKVEFLNPGYKLSIGIPSYMFLTTILCDYTSDQDFLNYVFSELKTRNYMRVYFYKVVRTPDSREVQ